MQINDFELIHGENGTKAWKEMRRRGTKQHRTDSENLSHGGNIPYGENEYGFDMGQYFEDFLKKLSDKNPQLFQPPLNGTAFDRKSNPSTW